MTTFEFKMTPRAYYAGWRVLQRQQLRLQWVFCALCAVLAAAGILLYFLLQDVAETAILPALSGIVAAMAVLLPCSGRSRGATWSGPGLPCLAQFHPPIFRANSICVRLCA